MCFNLKFYYTFESYQNMLSTLGYVYCIINYNFVFLCHAHYITFTCSKGLLKKKKLKKMLNLIFL